ncbi:L-1%2C2-propanediol oxidoreductase [Chlamydia trachomatis]|nr:L-1%2C2-propanediol oxidoreductase [Chlamydia trachomatis]
MTHYFGRTRQLITAKVMGMIPYKQELVVGTGKLDNLADLLEKEEITSVFVITTPGMVTRGSLAGLFDKFDHAGISYTIFTEIQPDPTIENVLAAKSAYLSHIQAS